MKYSDNNDLCLTYSELVPQFMSESNYKKSKLRGKIVVYGRGGNGNEVLISYESLPEKYKEAVKAEFGDPYSYYEKSFIRNLIETDEAAESYYKTYILPQTGLKLPEEYRDKYIKAANWIKTITHLTEDKRHLKRTLNVSIADFWQLITGMIEVENVFLPTSDKRLKARLTQFKSEGYECLIEKHRFGNENGKKIRGEKAEAVLLKLIGDGHRHDDTIVASAYNQWAVKNGMEPVTAAAVGVWRRNNQHRIIKEREGAAATYNKMVKHIHRDRASAPLLFVNSDDNVLDLFFVHKRINKAGKVVKNDFYRPVMYVVMDTFNDYPLGYAVGDAVTIDLIKEAYRNAMRHVMDLTGGAYLWHQIQTDRWNIDPKLEGELASYFKSQAHFTPAAAKVAQGKYIERVFGTPLHQVLKMFPNYSGHNITARERISGDTIERARKEGFPDRDQVPAVVEGIMQIMRGRIDESTGMSKQDEWLRAFRESEKSKAKAIDTEKRLELFGIAHKEMNRITAAGILPQINRTKYVYDAPEWLFPRYVNKQVQVIYDPYDMSEVLVTDGSGLRFTTSVYNKVPGALADRKEGDGARYNMLRQEKKDIMRRIDEDHSDRLAILERNQIDAASILQAGILAKSVNHAAQKKISAPAGQVTDWDDEEEVINHRNLY